MLQKKKKISKERLLNVRGERRDADQRGHPDQQQRRYGFIEKALVDIGRLLQNDSVATRALGGACGRRARVCVSVFLLPNTLSLSLSTPLLLLLGHARNADGDWRVP